MKSWKLQVSKNIFSFYKKCIFPKMVIESLVCRSSVSPSPGVSPSGGLTHTKQVLQSPALPLSGGILSQPRVPIDSPQNPPKLFFPPLNQISSPFTKSWQAPSTTLYPISKHCECESSFLAFILVSGRQWPDPMKSFPHSTRQWIIFP